MPMMTTKSETAVLENGSRPLPLAREAPVPAPGRRKLVTIITPVYNEEKTVRHCYEEVRRLFESLADRYDYEHLFADNCSEDRTLALLKEIAAEDPHVRVLAYSRNFGAEKSGFTAMKYASGDAVIG